jgi:hypothetical protein
MTGPWGPPRIRKPDADQPWLEAAIIWLVISAVVMIGGMVAR